MSPSAAMDDPITFTGGPLDRAGNLRRDPEWLAAEQAKPESLFLPLHELKALVDLGRPAELGWRSRTQLADFLATEPPVLFLGRREEISHFAVDVSAIEAPKAAPFTAGGKFIDARSIAALLPPGHAATMAQARAMIDWHRRHQFCAVCGKKTEIREGGYARYCLDEACGAQHFPRTDPVVIMLVELGEDCLLGRQKTFPEGTYSALAGFMEPGESIEEAVRREIWEEASVPVGPVRYLASQHWPFPSSLMIGCIGEALARDIRIDPVELQDARWFSRAEMQAMIDNAGGKSGFRMPPPLSMAYQLAVRWLTGL